MLGAIAGDVIGSVYETFSTKTKDFELFMPRSRFTDDTVLTIATADCLLHQKEYQIVYLEYGRTYPKKKYGARFLEWIFSPNPQPYNSFGNGSAMRVSPIGFFYDQLSEVLLQAEQSAMVTHNHPEGIKGAQAVASAVFLAKTQASKAYIKEFIADTFGYDLHKELNNIRPHYQFDVTCQGSVPESILAFLESNSYEDAIRNAISLGGDSDTMACIAGGIAQAYYKKTPEWISEEVKKRLNEDFLEIIEKFEKRINL